MVKNIENLLIAACNSEKTLWLFAILRKPFDCFQFSENPLIVCNLHKIVLRYTQIIHNIFFKVRTYTKGYYCLVAALNHFLLITLLKPVYHLYINSYVSIVICLCRDIKLVNTTFPNLWIVAFPNFFYYKFNRLKTRVKYTPYCSFNLNFNYFLVPVNFNYDSFLFHFNLNFHSIQFDFLAILIFINFVAAVTILTLIHFYFILC